MVLFIVVCLIFCMFSPTLMFTGSFAGIAIISEIVALSSMIAIPTFYALIYRHMKRSHRRARGKAPNTAASSVSRNVLILISIFLACRFPGFLSSLIYLAKQSRSIDQLLLSRIGMLFATLNSCANPFVYVFLDNSYRTTLIKLYRRSNPSQKVEHSTSKCDIQQPNGDIKLEPRIDVVLPATQRERADTLPSSAE